MTLLRRAAMALLLCVLTMTVQTAWAETETINVSYIDENGNISYHDATVFNDELVNGHNPCSLSGGWYVITSDIYWESYFNFDGEVHLILADGVVANICGSGVYSASIFEVKNNLTIYGQSNQTGSLQIIDYGNPFHHPALLADNLNIYGGKVSVCGADGEGYLNGATAVKANVHFYGGQFEARGGDGFHSPDPDSVPDGQNGVGIDAGSITLSWRNVSDRFYASSINCNSITIAEGKIFIDEVGTIYNSGTVSSSAINGKNLTPPYGNWSDHKAAAFSTINESAKTISITSEAELALLAYNTCAGTDYSGYTITLTRDLNMSILNWDKPIGSDEYHSFSGTFNGDNKTISGINISSSGDNKGLFGFVGRNENPGIIQNLTLANSTITGANYVGGIVGYLLYGTVSNCHVLSSVSILASSDNSHSHGGIVGRTYPNKKVSNATIEDCTSAASVMDNGKSGCSDFGGIVGYNYYYSDTYFSKVMGCFYYGTAVSASSDVGAIVGLNYKADGTGISNCYYNYPSTISGIGYGNTDNGTTRVYTVTCTTSGLSTTGTATYTHNGTHYFAAGATVTVTLGAANKAITSLSATSGTISNVSIAPDGQSATFTVGSSDVTDVTVSATLKALSGTTEDGLTWSLGGTNYTELTIGGTGPMQAYGYTTGNIWKTKAPWGTDITSVTIGDGVTSIGNYAFIGCENVASVTIGSGVTSIGIGAINHCDQMTTVTLPASVTTIAYAAFENCQKLETIYINHDGEVSLTGNYDNAFNAPLLQYIAFSSPAGALANTKETGNWARYKDNIRARFGNQLFLATNEGGTPAYAITNESDLRNLAAAVNAGNYGSEKTFRQTKDITMTGGNFTPIGNFDGNNLWFSGTYNGGGYTISGLTVSGEYLYASLFGYIKNGNVSYVNVLNPSISSSSKSSYEGAIVAFLSSGSVSNCYFYGGNQDDAIGYWLTWDETTITNVGRAYAVNILSSGVEATGNGFTHGTDRYLSGTVTLSGGLPAEVPEFYTASYTVNGTAISTNTFSITADSDVAAAVRSDGQSHSVTYMKADGSTDTHDAIALDETMTTLQAGQWYFVGADITFGQQVTLGDGEVTIILCDGKTMNIGTSSNGIGNDAYGIYGDISALTIYGQSLNDDAAGHLNIYMASDGGYGINISYFTQHSGNVSVTTVGDYWGGIRCSCTLNGGTLKVNAGDDAIRGNIIAINGGKLDAITSNGGAAGIKANTIVLGWTNATDHILVSRIKIYGTVKIAAGKPLAYIDGDNVRHVLGGDSETTLTADEIAAIAGKTLRPAMPVKYIDENGDEQNCYDYTVLKGSNGASDIHLSGGWYVVDGNNSCYNSFIFEGNTHIILCDGSKLAINNRCCIESRGDLTIYGQSAGTGTLNLTTPDNPIVFSINAIYHNVVINGGIITATSAVYDPTVYHQYICGIECAQITINSGNVTVISYLEGFGDSFGIHGNVSLNWRSANDRFYASSINGTVTIAPGKAFVDEDGMLHTSDNVGTIISKTLMGVDVLQDAATNDIAALATRLGGKQTNVVLSGRKLWKDGYWNTLVLPFPIANIEAEGCPLKGATVRELDDASITGTTLNLTFGDATTEIEAGVPYIVKWDGGTAGQYTENPVFQGVTIDATTHSYDNQAGGDTNVRFIGTYDQKTVGGDLQSPTEDRSILFLGAANTLYYPSGPTTIGACRAYFKIGSGTALARQLTAFNLNFADGESQGITTTDYTDFTDKAGAWYSLDGVRLDGKPTRKGLYIHGGRKVVIK